MDITDSSSAPFLVRFYERFGSYLIVGFSTFLFDLLLIWIFTTKFDINGSLAISVAFLIAVHLNYLALRYWVYRKTLEHLPRTYTYFITLAVTASLVIPWCVVWFQQFLGVEMIIARVIVSALLGMIGFLFNTFFNFKLL